MKIIKINNIKQRVFLGVTAAVTMALVSCGEIKNEQDAEVNTPKEQAKVPTAEISEASFSDAMAGKVFHNYKQIRLALINSDAGAVQTAARNLAENLEKEQENMKLTALAMAETNDLGKQRELFSLFTEKVEPLFKATISKGAIYKQYCPMAFEGEGGFWLSNSDEIRNPYYGEQMLKCGKIVATIEK